MTMYRVFRAVEINEAPDQPAEWWIVDMCEADDGDGPIIVARHQIEHEAIRDAEKRNRE